ncbi:peptide methionine sulfoxide reductase [Musa troglodytarum]|uniref:peptide-methionine (S)-S-oxide reductase n=1 Tax=Musa troglodytarum TaxID=320322 RepID=A0A9E7G0S2_9LILI|nr:peptide methionine sulfoxide reductase [Musa troglodytarum]
MGAGGQMISVHPEELTFELELEKPSYCNIKVVNNTEHHVAFKVKTTSPTKYFVRPNASVVQPWDSCTVTVSHQAQKEYPPDMQCKDKFLIQSAKVPPSSDMDEMPSDTFNKDCAKVIEELKLRVVYTFPSQSGHANSEEESGLASSASGQRGSDVRYLVNAQELKRRGGQLQFDQDILKRRRNRKSDTGFSLTFAAFAGLVAPPVSPCFVPSSFPSSPPSRINLMSWLGKLGFVLGSRGAAPLASSAIAQGPDDDVPATGQEFAQFGAGCFWGVELAFQRVPGVTRTEVGYSQGNLHEPTYEDVCSGTTNNSEIVRVQYDPRGCSYGDLLEVFWARHDPTTVNRQGNDVGTQYRSGIYFYTPEQEKAAGESMERHQKAFSRKIVTEILPAKKFYKAEEYHQQYLEKGGRFGHKQSASKGCSDPIRCYG